MTTIGTSFCKAPWTPMLPCSIPTAACSSTACGRPVTSVYPAAILTASVSCQDSTKAGPGLCSSFWRAKASHIGDHSEPGEDMM